MTRARFRAIPVLLAAALLSGACARRKPETAARAPRATRKASIEHEARPGQWEVGLASWYGGGDGFEGKPTASGELMDPAKMTAAHRTLPLGTWVDVVNTDTGQSARVRINDRGPFVAGRVIDLSKAAARQLGVVGPGVAPVKLTVVSAGPPEVIVSASGRWSVQIGSFASAFRAETLAEKMRASGRAVYTEPYGGLTRVKIGPLPSREAADRELVRLEGEGLEGILVPAPAT